MFRTGRHAGSTVQEVFKRDPEYVVWMTMYAVEELYSEDDFRKQLKVPLFEPARFDVNELMIRRIIKKRNNFDYRPDIVRAAYSPSYWEQYPFSYSICLQIQDHAWWDALETAPLAEQKKMILSERDNFSDLVDCCGVRGINKEFFARLQEDVENPEAVEAARALCSEKRVCLHCARCMTKESAATPNAGYKERFIHKKCWWKIREDYNLYSYGEHGGDYGPDPGPCKHKETPEQRERREKRHKMWADLAAENEQKRLKADEEEEQAWTREQALVKQLNNVPDNDRSSEPGSV